MQINSVNNQNSFGLTISPRLKNELRRVATEVFSKDGDKGRGYKYTPKVRDIFEKRVQKLKEMMPGAKLDLVDTWTRENAYIFGIRSQHPLYEYPEVADIPAFAEKIILKRKGMPDKFVEDAYILADHLGVQRLLKKLQRIEQEEKEPVLKAAIERTKKLLP